MNGLKEERRRPKTIKNRGGGIAAVSARRELKTYSIKRGTLSKKSIKPAKRG